VVNLEPGYGGASRSTRSRGVPEKTTRVTMRFSRGKAACVLPVVEAIFSSKIIEIGQLPVCPVWHTGASRRRVETAAGIR